MIEKRQLTFAALLAVMTMLAGCSTTLGGTAVAAPAAGNPGPRTPLPAPTFETTPSVLPATSGVTETTSSLGTVIHTDAAIPASTPASHPLSTPASGSTNGITGSLARFGACPSVEPTDSAGIVACLRKSVADFWSGEINQVIDQPVVIDPRTDQIPAECLEDVTNSKAFTCRVNDTVYINDTLLMQIDEQFGAAEAPYALAAVVSHEVGHVVQGAVKQPGYADPDKSDALSKQIEEQADCLSGVWAHSEISHGKLDRAAFVTITGALITSISTSDEITTHGTPAERAAQLAKGLTNGRPQDCELAT